MTGEQAELGTGTTIRSVSFVVFDLRFEEPGGVLVPGAADRDAETEHDRAHLILDTAGPDRAVRLPGTSVAGSLRAMIETERDKDTADDLFGHLLDPDGPDSREDVDAVASRIWVLGTHRKDTAPPLYRTSTAVDRHRAAAKENTLRGEELLPAGSEFEIFLRWDDAPGDQLRDLAELVAAWRPFIGRGVSRGRGACTARAVRYGTLRLDEPAGLARWLKYDGPALAAKVATETVPEPGPAGREPVLRATIELDGPFRTGNGVKPEKDSGQPVPLLRVNGKPVMPGASLKGLLRSRAEFILRTVGIPACGDQRCPRDGACWPCRVFGRGGGEDNNARSVGARSLLRIPDAVIRDAVTAERTHVAIDRFTGGGLDHALYTDEVLEAGRFELRVDSFEPVGTLDLPAREIRAVLRLVLQDLDDGLIGLGGGTTRGYGTVKVTGLDALPSADEARMVLKEMAAR